MPNIGNGSGNSNNFRKIGTFDRIKPVSVQVVQNNLTKSFDGNRLVIHRDAYYIDQPFVLIGVQSSALYPTGEYAEDVISFSGGTTANVTFSTPFTQKPIITLTVDPGPQENIVAFVTNYSSSGFTVELTAPLNGYNVTYRAIYSPTYPAIVQRSPLNPTMYYTASAGEVEIVNGSYFSGSFDSLGSIPTNVFVTNRDSVGNGGAAVAYVSGVAYDTTTVVGDFSSVTGLTVSYIVTK